MVNARLSKKTVQHRWLYPYYRLALMSVERIYARNKDDAAAYARLSGRLDKVDCAGQLKTQCQFFKYIKQQGSSKKHHFE